MLLKKLYNKLVAKVNSIDAIAFVLKTKYDIDKTELDEKISDIDAIAFVLKTKYDIDKTELDEKISDTGDLVKKIDCNGKITEIEGKIPSISGLAKNVALTAVELEV